MEEVFIFVLTQLLPDSMFLRPGGAAPDALLSWRNHLRGFVARSSEKILPIHVVLNFHGEIF